MRRRRHRVARQTDSQPAHPAHKPPEPPLLRDGVKHRKRAGTGAKLRQKEPVRGVDGDARGSCPQQGAAFRGAQPGCPPPHSGAAAGPCPGRAPGRAATRYPGPGPPDPARFGSARLTCMAAVRSPARCGAWRGAELGAVRSPARCGAGGVRSPARCGARPAAARAPPSRRWRLTRPRGSAGVVVRRGRAGRGGPRCAFLPRTLRPEQPRRRCLSIPGKKEV